MNHRSTGLQATKAVQGFLQYKQAEGLSAATIFNYQRELKLWMETMGDKDIGLITSDDLLSFINFMRTEYVPRRITGGNDRKLSDKTVYNFYVSLSALFTWATNEFEIPNPMKKVPRPRVPEDPPVEPLKREEIDRLLKACDTCAEADPRDRRKFIMRRSTGRRDKAILLLLLDTGLRASELCALRIGDVNMKTGRFPEPA
jgi:integrase/recombinase XerD